MFNLTAPLTKMSTARACRCGCRPIQVSLRPRSGLAQASPRPRPGLIQLSCSSHAALMQQNTSADVTLDAGPPEELHLTANSLRSNADLLSGDICRAVTPTLEGGAKLRCNFHPNYRYNVTHEKFFQTKADLATAEQYVIGC